MSVHVPTTIGLVVALVVLVWVTRKYLRGDVDEYLAESALAGDHGDAETAMNLLLASGLTVGFAVVGVWQWSNASVRWAFLMMAAVTGVIAVQAYGER
jgi:hypothetical protein